MDLYRMTKRLIEKYRLRPRKRLGQHFLVDEKIANYIVALARPRSNYPIIEIGAGLGALTRPLSKYGNMLIAIELDRRLIPALVEVIRDIHNIQVILADFLKLEFMGRFSSIVSNLPYYITSHILFKLLELDFEVAVLALQKEYGYRLMAKPGTEHYSRITVMVNLLADVKARKVITRRAFYPRPEVDSIVIEMRKRKLKLKTEDLEFFKSIVTGLFTYRRKRVTKALKYFLSKSSLNVDAERILSEARIGAESRVYWLSVDDFIRLAEAIKQTIGSNLHMVP
ncbi:MAG: ribosomal RNA small subunit methyltransferase A [Thermoprotei archaeon]|nr:MAG: ribosomal RNA small subunit methyltransferase A [Thermoprotei archaeon]